MNGQEAGEEILKLPKSKTSEKGRLFKLMARIGGNRTFCGDPVVLRSIWQLSGKCGYKRLMVQKALHSCSSLMTLPFTRPEMRMFIDYGCGGMDK